jgi:hypothetical protein
MISIPVRHLAGALLLAVVCAGSVGCSSSASMSGWRDAVERYVKDEGGGDPSVLKELTIDRAGTTRGFSLLGGDRATESTEARGRPAGPSSHQRPAMVRLSRRNRAEPEDDRDPPGRRCESKAASTSGGPARRATTTQRNDMLEYTRQLASERLGKRDAASPAYTTLPARGRSIRPRYDW